VILALHERPGGVAALPGNRVVYDLERDEAQFGAVGVAGPALVWELRAEAAGDAALEAEVDLDEETGWIMRCDRIDFPPGGVAYRHTHPGPGIRRLLFGSIRIDTAGASHEYGPGGAWFESGPEPVFAAASEVEPSAFVRVLLLPREWEGKRTIRYLDPADEEKPKLQRPTVYFDRPIEL
jgi:quercetin dioxygenase-like cupin family protein